MLRQDELKAGGLALDGATVSIEDANWTLDAPAGYSSQNGTPLFALFTLKDMSTNELHEQHFACGNLGDTCTPNADNPRMLDNPGGAKIVKSTNFAYFVVSMFDKGMPQPPANSSDLSFFQGAVIKLERKAVERAGLAVNSNSKSDGKVYVCSEVVKKPGKGGASAAPKAPPAAGKAAASAPAAQKKAPAAAPVAQAASAGTGITLTGDDALDLEAYYVHVIGSGETKPVAQVKPMLMKAMMADKAQLTNERRSALLAIAGNMEALASAAANWTNAVFDPDTNAVTVA